MRNQKGYCKERGSNKIARLVNYPPGAIINRGDSCKMLNITHKVVLIVRSTALAFILKPGHRFGVRKPYAHRTLIK